MILNLSDLTLSAENLDLIRWKWADPDKVNRNCLLISRLCMGRNRKNTAGRIRLRGNQPKLLQRMKSPKVHLN